jgi:GH15 family glucan-1,4-alpha-glucosidase
MATEQSYIKAKELLVKASSSNGFLASANNITNYKRVWSRDGVICGLAALLDGDADLVETFKSTLVTLANNQHELGHIPSNVNYVEDGIEVSFGGLAGRVDTISWFIIGICNYVHFTKNTDFLEKHLSHIEKGYQLLNAWEFNNNHLIYVPRSGNWADEYITEGHIFYDQVLRLWALRCIQKLCPNKKYEDKINIVTKKIEDNYRSGNLINPYHPNAYQNLESSNYWAASVSPSGYQTMFDAFGNSIALLLNIGGSVFTQKIIKYSENLRSTLPLKLLPAFWEPIHEGNPNWETLLNNCKYEFRNYPYQFHNGGTWQMVNGFYGIAMVEKDKNISREVLKHIKSLNNVEDYSFYENFDSKTEKPNGVSLCTWSAAAEILLENYINGKKLLV